MVFIHRARSGEEKGINMHICISFPAIPGLQILHAGRSKPLTAAAVELD